MNIIYVRLNHLDEAMIPIGTTRMTTMLIVMDTDTKIEYDYVQL